MFALLRNGSIKYQSSENKYLDDAASYLDPRSVGIYYLPQGMKRQETPGGKLAAGNLWREPCLWRENNNAKGTVESPNCKTVPRLVPTPKKQKAQKQHHFQFIQYSIQFIASSSVK